MDQTHSTHPLLAQPALINLAATGQKSLGVLPPPIHEDFPDLLQPVAQSALELAVGVNIDTLNADNPIRLNASIALDPDDTLLLVGYDEDSGLYLPIGAGRSTDAGTELRIDRLPGPGLADEGGKSIGGMLMMAGYKIAGATGLVENPFPLLRSAHVDANGNLAYHEDGIGALRARVAAARRIALLIHGFTGDTRTMIHAIPRLSTQQPYDLILAYDYENLNTRIQDSAIALGQRLAEIGLAAGHAKTLDLIAHSLGTQVSRWFIEREGGAKVVRKAVLLGPPNSGTPLAVLQEWLVYLLGLGLNSLLTSVAPAQVVTYASYALKAGMAGLDRLVVTLDQLKPGSDFYTDLNASADPGIPYHVIIGDTAQVKYKPVDVGSTADGLFRRVFAKATRDRLMSAAFAGQPNDLAISVTSAQKVAGLGRAPAPVISVVACDHLNYFDAGSPGLAELGRALSIE
jgi:hypothetical protein